MKLARSSTWERSWTQDTCCRAARSAVFKRNFEIADEDSHSTDSSVSGEEGHSDPLRVVPEAGVLVRLSTPAKAAISRERKVQTNPAEKMRNVRGIADSNVNDWHTLNQFKGEHLTVASGKL